MALDRSGGLHTAPIRADLCSSKCRTPAIAGPFPLKRRPFPYHYRRPDQHLKTPDTPSERASRASFQRQDIARNTHTAHNTHTQKRRSRHLDDRLQNRHALHMMSHQNDIGLASSNRTYRSEAIWRLWQGVTGSAERQTSVTAGSGGASLRSATRRHTPCNSPHDGAGKLGTTQERSIRRPDSSECVTAGMARTCRDGAARPAHHEDVTREGSSPQRLYRATGPCRTTHTALDATPPTTKAKQQFLVRDGTSPHLKDELLG